MDELCNLFEENQLKFLKAFSLYHEKYVEPYIAARKLEVSKKLKEAKKKKNKRNETKERLKDN